MADYGLLKGIGEGISAGIDTYMAMKKMKHDQRLTEMTHGIRENPETGEMEYTPQALLKQQTEAQDKKNQREMEFLKARIEAGKGGFLLNKKEDGSFDMQKDPSYVDQDRQYKNLQIQKMQQELTSGGKDQKGLLAPGAKEQITKLSGDSATKLSIANSIDATIQNLDNPDLSPDQKLMQARQLIKTLNSTQGQDAVGAEEAKRLAGFLEFRMFNVTEPGKMFGRDVDEFTNQAKITANSLRSAVEANKGLISDISSGKQTDFKKYEIGKKPEKGLIGKEKEKSTANQKPDFSKMSDDELKKYIGQ